MTTPLIDRRATRRRRPESLLLKLPFRPLHNSFPPLEMLSPEQLEQTHLAWLRICEEIGLEFWDDEESTPNQNHPTA
jgi:trimethylamine:corrinoid methyltransferase-like protein